MSDGTAADAATTAWRSVMVLFVMIMQFGFATRALGLLPARHVTSLMFRQLLTLSTVFLVYWFISYTGAGWAYLSTRDSDLLWTMMTTITAVTIFATGTTSRLRTIVYSALLTTVVLAIMPAFRHMFVGPHAFLNQPNAMFVLDWAGAQFAHIIGGTACLVVSTGVGPRPGRFVGGRRNTRFADEHANLWTDPSTILRGTLMEWIGWLGLNLMPLSMSQSIHMSLVSVIITNSLVASGTAVCTSVALNMVRYRKYNIRHTSNALLVGMASIAAGCAVLPTEYAAVCGAVAAVAARVLPDLVARMGVDDVADAWVIHAASGVIGMALTGLLASDSLIVVAFDGQGPVVAGRRSTQFFVQLLGCVLAAAVSAVGTFVVIAFMHFTIGLRLDSKEQLLGVDETAQDLEGGDGQINVLEHLHMDEHDIVGMEDEADGAAPGTAEHLRRWAAKLSVDLDDEAKGEK